MSDPTWSSPFLDTVRDLLEARDSGAVLTCIASRACRLLTRDTAAVYLLGDGKDTMKAVAAEGMYARELAGETVIVGTGILGSIAASGTAEIVNDTYHDERGINVASTPDTQENEKLMGSPLVSRGKVIGVMAIWRDVDEPPFSPDDLATLVGFSSLAVIAIENARSYEETQLRIARLSSMMEIGRVLVSTRDPAKLLETVHRQMSRLFDTTNFYVATHVQGSREWVWALHYENGLPQPLERHELGAGLTGFILMTRRPVLLRDRDEVRRFLEEQGVLGLGELPQSWMGVPLLAGDEITGVMAIQSYDKPRLYAEGDLEFFSLIGTQVAVALQNARLFEEAREARERAEEAQETARQQLEIEKREHELTERLRSQLQSSLDRLRSAQNQLIISEKMAILGSLVSGMAHEINTPVGTALTAATYLREQANELSSLLGSCGLDGDRGVEHCLEGIRQSVELTHANLERAVGFIGSFKQVSVDQTSEARRRFDLGRYLADTVLSLQPRLKKTPIAVRIDCPEGLVIDSYPGAFSQILTNFIINSLIHGFRAPDADSRIDIRARLVEGRTLELDYADNGEGMSLKSLGRLFEPFYTTTRGAGGTGLGTNIAYNLVTQRLRGSIAAESAPGEGLRYSMRIPLGPGEVSLGDTRDTVR